MKTNKPVYLSISLYHPSILRGGSQHVAKDLFDAASEDPDYEAFLLCAVDINHFKQYNKVGASITRLNSTGNEFLLLTESFDNFYQTVFDNRRNKAIRAFLRQLAPAVIHIHHSILIGIDILDLVRQECPESQVIYTLHEYMPICNLNGQLFRYREQSICTNFGPEQCVGCFPEYSSDEFSVRKRLFHEYFSMVDKFIAPSDALKNSFVEWGLADSRIVTIPNGHDKISRLTGAPALHSAKLNRLGFFGQYVDAKGIDVLISAASMAAKSISQEIFVYVYGGNRQYASETYRQKIDALISHAPDNVQFKEMGPYGREEVIELMRDLDWVVVPSVWPETFALVVSEAWEARRPVIASRAGGLADRIRHGENGLLFTPSSVSALSDLIAECVGNKDLWMKLYEGISDEISVNEAWQRHKRVLEDAKSLST